MATKYTIMHGANAHKHSIAGRQAIRKKAAKAFPTLTEFLEKRDYTGAITLLEVSSCLQWIVSLHAVALTSEQFLDSSGKRHEQHDAWVGYCAFHLGEYKKALAVHQLSSRLV